MNLPLDIASLVPSTGPAPADAAPLELLELAHSVSAPEEPATHSEARETPPASIQRVPTSPVKLLVGGMHAGRERHQLVEITDLNTFLSEPQPPDTVVAVSGESELYVLDADVHHWPTKPDDDYLNAIAASITPTADFSYISHGRGLKLLFIGSKARQRALGAALGMPGDFALEIAQQFRHPRAFSTKHGAEAGPVHYEPTAGNGTFSFNMAGVLRSEQVAELLAQRGMTMGSRHDHNLCPIAGHLPSDAGACVIALSSGIFCHRCAGKGLCFAGINKSGVIPYSALIPGTAPFVADLASNLVHAEHARHEMAHRHPNLGPKLRDEIYRLALEDVHGPDDPRISMVFNGDLQVLYSEGGWVGSSTCKPTVLDNDIVDFMPGANYVETTVEDGVTNKKAKVDRIQRSNFKSREPRGYTPVRLFRGILLAARPGTVPLEAPPKQRYPIRLLDKPLSLDETMARLQEAFPGINAGYLQGVLAAAICADVSGGPPAGITCTGPSGSGKGETISVAASCLGDMPVKVQLDADPAAFMRQIGSSTASGNRFLVFDELGKQAGLSKKWASILQIGAVINYRPLYGQSLLSVECRSAIFFPCVLFPDWLRSSPEFRRRTRGVHLPSKTANWYATCGGDAAGWRGRGERNALVCNSLLTHVYRACVEANFVFDNTPGCVADRLGLGSISDGAEGVDPEHLRNLYRYARGQLGERAFFEKDSTFTRGWLDLTAARAASLISVFADGDEHDVRALRRAVQMNLLAASWNDTLEIATPVTIDIKIHGSRWGMRFRNSTPCARGQEVLNDKLPPIPGDELANTATGHAALDGAGPSRTPASQAAVPAAESNTSYAGTVDPLGTAGFPT